MDIFYILTELSVVQLAIVESVSVHHTEHLQIHHNFAVTSYILMPVICTQILSGKHVSLHIDESESTVGEQDNALVTSRDLEKLHAHGRTHKTRHVPGILIQQFKNNSKLKKYMQAADKKTNNQRLTQILLGFTTSHYAHAYRILGFVPY